MAEETVYDGNRSLDEIVFENRNKEYGAYDLRHNYPRILTRSFLLGTGLFLLIALSPFIYLTIKNLTAPPKQEVKADLVNIIQEDKIIEQPKEKEAPPPPPPPKAEQPKQEVIQNVVPEPKRAPKVETPPPPITKQLETTTGLKNQEGEKVVNYTPPPPPPAPTGTKTAAVEVKPQVSETQVYTEVEQQAEFPGSINAFRSKVSENFDSSAMAGGEGTLKTEVSFVVERDGSITDVKANGANADFNSEAVRTVKSIKTKWSPAKINGQPVRYRFRLPLTMNFE